MKKYIVALSLLAYTQLMAESNPFDLHNNLQKIDKDQDALLSELKKLSQKKKNINLLKEQVDEEREPTAIDENITIEKDILTEEKNVKVQEDEAEKLSDLKEQQLQAEDERTKLLKEQEKLEVEAYEIKKRAKEKILASENEVDSQKLPKELEIYRLLIDAKTKTETTMLDGKIREVCDKLLKERNNPNFKISSIKEEMDNFSKKEKEKIGFMLIAYMMGKSVVLQETMGKKEMDDFTQKFQNVNFNDGDKMKSFMNKYPHQIKKLGFDFLEDILKNGIPQLNLNMQMSGKYSSLPGESEPFKIEMDASTKAKENKEAIVDIDIAHEKHIEKQNADEEYLKAINEVN